MNKTSQATMLLAKHTKLIGNQFIISDYQNKPIWSKAVLEEISYILLIAYVNLIKINNSNDHQTSFIDAVIDNWSEVIIGFLGTPNTPQTKMAIKKKFDEKYVKYIPIISQILGERLNSNDTNEMFYKYELYELFLEEIKYNFNERLCQKPTDGIVGAMNFINNSKDNEILCQEIFDEKSVIMLSLKYNDIDEMNEYDKIAIKKNQNKKAIRKRAVCIRDGVVNFLTDSQDNQYDKEDKGSLIGSSAVPIFILISLSKLLVDTGLILGFIGFMLCYIGYTICYGMTYEKINAHKVFKEIIAIIAGIFGLLLVFAIIITIAHSINSSNNNTKDNTTSQNTVNIQSTQNTTITPNNIKTPTFSNEPQTVPQLNPKAVLAEAENSYNNAVANINSVWNSLQPSTQDFLRAEQRAINKKREADCAAYGNTQSVDKDLAMAYRYACEIPQLNERTEYLKTQLNTVVALPKPKNVGPAYQQNHQAKDSFVLSQMMNIYQNPQSAPPVYLCQGDIYCNAFFALSQYWVHIPDSYRYQGEFNIKFSAQIGDAYGLNKGFTLKKEQSVLLADSINLYYANSGENSSQEKTLSEGLAVLLYIEDMNGWL